MLPLRWMEAYVSFLLSYRWPVLVLALVITLFLTSQLFPHTNGFCGWKSQVLENQ